MISNIFVKVHHLSDIPRSQAAFLSLATFRWFKTLGRWARINFSGGALHTAILFILSLLLLFFMYVSIKLV